MRERIDPYYADAWSTIYCGDARDILPTLTQAYEVVITDPVWPGAPPRLLGHEEPGPLLSAVSTLLVDCADRLVIHLGSQTDPRFLSAVDARWPFLAVQFLEYAMPVYRARTLLNDVAYTFGRWPTGPGVVPGRLVATATLPRQISADEHPCARAMQHVQALVRWWVRIGPVLDPFAGSGTTLVAAKRAGVRAVGIEAEARFCDLTVSRLRQDRFDFAQDLSEAPEEIGGALP